MAEDSTCRNIRGPRPYSDRFFFVNEDDKLVVSDAGTGFLGRAQAPDASLFNHRLVVFFVSLGFIADINIGPPIRRGLECKAHGKVTKLVEHGAKLVVSRIPAGRKTDKSGQGFKKPPRQPDHRLRCRIVLVELNLAEFAGESLRPRNAAIEINIVTGSTVALPALFGLGCDFDGRG